MSAYKRLECSFVDREALLEALRQLGFTPEEHDIPQFLRGYQGEHREEKAHIIVGREQVNKLFTSASNDIGFFWNEEKGEYELLCSRYDSRLGVDQRIKQAYAKVVVEQALAAQGFKVKVNTPIEDLQSRKRTQITIQTRKLI